MGTKRETPNQVVVRCLRLAFKARYPAKTEGEIEGLITPLRQVQRENYGRERTPGEPNARQTAGVGIDPREGQPDVPSASYGVISASFTETFKGVRDRSHSIRLVMREKTLEGLEALDSTVQSYLFRKGDNRIREGLNVVDGYSEEFNFYDRVRTFSVST